VTVSYSLEDRLLCWCCEESENIVVEFVCVEASNVGVSIARVDVVSLTHGSEVLSIQL
jgi:hypothetical protein